MELLSSLDDDADETVSAKTQNITPKPLLMAESSKLDAKEMVSAKTQNITPKPLLMAESSMLDEKEMSPFFAPRSLLKSKNRDSTKLIVRIQRKTKQQEQQS